MIAHQQPSSSFFLFLNLFDLLLKPLLTDHLHFLSAAFAPTVVFLIAVPINLRFLTLFFFVFRVYVAFPFILDNVFISFSLSKACNCKLWYRCNFKQYLVLPSFPVVLVVARLQIIQSYVARAFSSLHHHHHHLLLLVVVVVLLLPPLTFTHFPLHFPKRLLFKPFLSHSHFVSILTFFQNRSGNAQFTYDHRFTFAFISTIKLWRPFLVTLFHSFIHFVFMFASPKSHFLLYFSFSSHSLPPPTVLFSNWILIAIDLNAHFRYSFVLSYIFDRRMKCEWGNAAKYAAILKDKCKWSPAMFTYLHAAFLFMDMEKNGKKELGAVISDELK